MARLLRLNEIGENDQRLNAIELNAAIGQKFGQWRLDLAPWTAYRHGDAAKPELPDLQDAGAVHLPHNKPKETTRLPRHRQKFWRVSRVVADVSLVFPAHYRPGAAFGTV